MDQKKLEQVRKDTEEVQKILMGERKNTMINKEWWEKEAAYEEVYRQGRQAKDLWKYIDIKTEEGVDETAIDEDGYWVYLCEGWRAYDGGEDCTIIHEFNIQDLKVALKTIRKV